MSTPENGFMDRWSKRKSDARSKTPETPELELQDKAAGPGDMANLAEQPGLPAPLPGAEPPGADPAGAEAEFDDVDFDKLDKSSDYTRFIRTNVPAAIQRRALRKLWASDPVFEVLDGMNDYDEDFTDAALAVKTLKTAWQVGKGYLKDEDEDGAPDAGGPAADTGTPDATAATGQDTPGTPGDEPAAAAGDAPAENLTAIPAKADNL